MRPAILVAYLLSIVHATPRSDDWPLWHPLVRQQECPVVLEPDSPFLESTRQYAPNSHDTRLRRPIVAQTRSSDMHTMRIVNGHRVFSERLVQMSVLFVPMPIDNDNLNVCYGSLISSRWVVTAARCQINNDTYVSVGANSVQVSSSTVQVENGRKNGVQKVVVHPDFQANDANDIALVELSEDAPSNQFMLVNTNGDIPTQGSFSRVLGYGKSMMGEEPSDTRNVLRQVDIPVFPIERCRETLTATVSSERQFCLGYEDVQCGVCIGDKGGAIFQYNEDDNPVLIGLATEQQGCAEAGTPSLHTRTDAFIDWMRENRAAFTPADQVRTVFGDGSIRPEGEGNNLTRIIIGCVVGVVSVAALLIGAAFFFRWRGRRNTSSNDPTPGLSEDHSIASGKSSQITLAKGGLSSSAADYSETPSSSTVILHSGQDTTDPPRPPPPPRVPTELGPFEQFGS